MGRRNSDTGRSGDGTGDWAGDEGQAFVDDLEQRSAYRQEVLDDVRTPPDALRDGGPTRSGGGLTTTGGTAGPASVRRVKDRNRGGQKVAPTTTGDATSGGMGTPAGGSTSDATTREA